MRHNSNLRQSIINACNDLNRLAINQGTSGNISVRDGNQHLIAIGHRL